VATPPVNCENLSDRGEAVAQRGAEVLQVAGLGVVHEGGVEVLLEDGEQPLDHHARGHVERVGRIGNRLGLVAHPGDDAFMRLARDEQAHCGADREQRQRQADAADDRDPAGDRAAFDGGLVHDHPGSKEECRELSAAR
jgi:hypothetical protein